MLHGYGNNSDKVVKVIDHKFDMLNAMFENDLGTW